MSVCYSFTDISTFIHNTVYAQIKAEKRDSNKRFTLKYVQKHPLFLYTNMSNARPQNVLETWASQNDTNPLAITNFIKTCYIQLYEKGKPKSLKHKTLITRSYLHAKVVAVTIM